eukprot:5468135-Prymnesium_polylepis.2
MPLRDQSRTRALIGTRRAWAIERDGDTRARVHSSAASPVHPGQHELDVLVTGGRCAAAVAHCLPRTLHALKITEVSLSIEHDSVRQPVPLRLISERVKHIASCNIKPEPNRRASAGAYCDAKAAEQRATGFGSLGAARNRKRRVAKRGASVAARARGSTRAWNLSGTDTNSALIESRGEL